MDSVCEPVVSIQRAVAANALEGHLGWGVLIHPEFVLTPAPFPWLDDPTLRLEVLLVSAQRDGPGYVERISPSGIDVAALDGSPEGAVALVQLAQRSNHQHFESRLDVDQLFEQLAGQTDVWTALEAIGAIPLGRRDLPVPAVLGPVVEWEVTLRAKLVTTHVIDLATPRWPFCPKILPWCDCPGQWWR